MVKKNCYLCPSKDVDVDSRIPAPSQGEIELTSNDPSSNNGGRSYTLFRGHAGPLHSATFSPLGDFLLSSSSDSTGKLLLALTFCILL